MLITCYYISSLNMMMVALFCNVRAPPPSASAFCAAVSSPGAPPVTLAPRTPPQWGILGNDDKILLAFHPPLQCLSFPHIILGACASSAPRLLPCGPSMGEPPSPAVL